MEWPYLTTNRLTTFVDSIADEVLEMNTNSFWKAGHTPTLFAAFLYFDLSFMVWYLLGPMAVQIATDLQLTTQQQQEYSD